MGCLFRVESDAFGLYPRVNYGLHLRTNSDAGDRVSGIYIANIVDGFSNVCLTSCSGCGPIQGIDVGCFAEYGLGTASTVPLSSLSFTTCVFQNCGVTGFASSCAAGVFDPTFSNCQFLYNGRRWPCANPSSLVLPGHGAAMLLQGGSSNADFQYSLIGGNFETGLNVRVNGATSDPTQGLRVLRSRSTFNVKEGILLEALRGVFGSWATGEANLMSTTVDNNGQGFTPGLNSGSGLRLYQDSTSSTGGWFSPSFQVSNLLVYRNLGSGISLRQDPQAEGVFQPAFNYLTSARNGREGLLGENVATTGANVPRIENATIRKNWNDGTALGGPFDVAGLTITHVRYANLLGSFPTFPNACTFPAGYGSAQNLFCEPEFVNDSVDDYHLVSNQVASKSLDTGLDDPVGSNPGVDFENNARVTDFGLDGPNGGLGSWQVADRACFERPN